MTKVEQDGTETSTIVEQEKQRRENNFDNSPAKRTKTSPLPPIRPDPIFDEWYPLRIENGQRRLKWKHSILHKREEDAPLEKTLKFFDVVYARDGFAVATVAPGTESSPCARLWLFPQSQPKFNNYKAQLQVLKGFTFKVRYWESKTNNEDWLLVDLVFLDTA